MKLRKVVSPTWVAAAMLLVGACEPEDKPAIPPNITPGDSIMGPDGKIKEHGPAHDTVFEVGGIRFYMKYIPGGSYNMGASSLHNSAHYDADADNSVESPVHEVRLEGFLMAETEVNEALYFAVTNSNPSTGGDLLLPVRYVSHTAANEFVGLLSKATGYRFRLPTEAEWEYAARGAGADSGDFSFSGSNDPTAVAWFEENSPQTPHYPGRKRANTLGIYDLTGNVAEWCSDWYGEYTGDSQTNPTGAPLPPTPNRQKRVVRGGSYLSARYYLRNTWRDSKYGSYEGNDVGIRLVMSAK